MLAFSSHADESNLTPQITESAHFANDLGLDSLDTVEVVMAIEEVRGGSQRENTCSFPPTTRVLTGGII